MSSAAALQLAPRLQPTTVPPGPGRPPRPALRVIEGGRAPGPRAAQAVYRRRRLVVATVLAVVLTVAVLLVNAALTGNAGDGTPAVAGTSAPAVHVVQPGDTLWSIAQSLHSGQDVRLVVDRLVDLNGGAPLTVGQRLALS